MIPHRTGTLPPGGIDDSSSDRDPPTSSPWLRLAAVQTGRAHRADARRFEPARDRGDEALLPALTGGETGEA